MRNLLILFVAEDSDYRMAKLSFLGSLRICQIAGVAHSGLQIFPNHFEIADPLNDLRVILTGRLTERRSLLLPSELESYQCR